MSPSRETATSVATIRLRARQLVAHALELGWEGPPFDMEVLASLTGLRLEEVDTLGAGRDASYMPGTILLSRQAPPKRRRYSVAHEIIHQFFPEGCKSEGVDASPEGITQGKLELLCQIGAAELLMPSDPFSKSLGPEAPTIHGIDSLAASFDVSIEAAARRTVDLSVRAVALLMARPLGDFESMLRVQTTGVIAIRGETKDDDLVVTSWIAPPRFSRIRVATGEPVPRRSCLRRAWGWGGQYPREGRVFRKSESWATYPELGVMDLEAATLPRRKKPIEVLAIVRRPE